MAIIREEYEVDVRDLNEDTNLAKSKFAEKQENIFDVVMTSVQKKEGLNTSISSWVCL